MLIGTFTFFISRLNALVFCGGWGRDPARAEPFFCWFINFISKSFLKLCRIYLIGIVCLMLIGTFTFFISRLNALVFCGGWGRDPARAEPFFCWFINFISKSFLKLCRIYLIGIVCLMLIGTFTFFISRLNALVFCGGWGRDPARAEPFFCWFINFISKSFLKLCRIYLIGIVCLMLIGTFTFFISRLNALVFCGGWGRDPARAEPFFCWFINFISKSFLKLCRIYLIGIVCLMLIGTFTFFISRLNALVFCGGWGRDPARAEPFFCWFINFISKSFLKLCRIYLIGIVCLMLIGTFTFFISRLNALVFCGGWGRDPARAEPFFCWFINFISKSFLKLCRIYLIGIVCLMLIGTFTFFISRLNALVFCGGWGRDPARAEPFFCWFINFISKSFLKLCRIYLIGIVCLMLIGTFTFFISRLNALVFCGGWGRDPARAEPFFCWFINFISKSFLKLCRIYLIGIVCLMLIGTFTFFISRLNALVFCGGWGRDPARAEPFFCWFINFISKSFLKLCRIYLIGIVCLMLIGTFTFFISRLNALVFCGGWGRDPARAEPFFCWFINFISKSFLKLCRIYLIGIVCLMLIGTFTFFISRLNALVFCGGWGRDPARAEPFFCWFINFISKSFLKLCRIYLIGIVCLMLIGTFTFFISRLNALVFCGGWGRDPARAEPFFCWFINFISKSFLKLCRIYLIGIVCLMLIGTFTFFISRLNALVFCGGWGRDPARAEPFFCWFINFISKSFLKLCRIYLIGIVCLMLIGTFTFFISRLNALVFCGGWGRDPARAEPFFCWFINFISKSFLKLCRIYLIGIVCLMLIGTFTFFISRLNALVFCGGWGRDPARAEPFFCWFINFISKSFLKLCRIYLIGIVCLMLIGTFTFFISRLNALVFCGGWGRDPARAEPFFCWFINFISKSFLKLCRIYLIGIVCLMLIGTFTFFISRLNALVFCGGWGRDPARAEPFFCWFINFISKSFLKLCRIYLIGIVCLMLIGTFTFFISRLNALVFCGGWGRDPARAEPFFCWFINFISKSFLKLCRIYLIGIVCLMLIGTFTFFISRLNALVFCGGWGRDPARAEPFFCWFINFISKSFLKLCRIYLIGIVCLMLIGTFTFFISRLNALVFCGGWGRDPARAEPFFCWFINFISKSFLKLCRIYLIGIVCLMLIGTFTFFISRLNALVFCGGWGRDPARAEPFFCWFINFISKSFLKLCRIYLIGIVCLMLIGTFTFFISRLNALVFCGGWGRDPARAEPFFCWFINFISKSFLKLCRIYLIGIVCLMLIGTFTFFISRLNALVFCGGWGRDPARAEPFFCWFINFISKSFLKLCRIYLIGIVCLMLIGTFTFFISRLNALVFCGGWGRDPARAEPFFCWFINFISKSFLKLCRIYLIGIVCLMLIGTFTFFISRLNALVFCGGWGRDPARAEPFFCWFINFISKSFLKLCRIYLIGIVCLMLIGTFTFFISRLNALVFCGGWGRDPARAEPFFCWFINFISKSFLKLCRIYLIGIVCLMLIGTFTFFISRLNALVFCGGWGRDPARAEPFFCWFINFISKSFLKLCRIYLIGIVCLMLIGTFTFFISRLNALVFCGGWGRDPARAEPFFCWFINFISKSFLKLCRIYLIGIVCLMLIGTFTFFISRLNALVFCGGWGRDPARAEPFFCWFINFISKSFLKLCRIYLIGIVCLMLIGTFTFFISRLNALVFCGGWGRDPARAEPFFCWFINFISKSFLKLCRIYLIGIVCLMLIGTFTFFISRLNALVFCGGWGRDPARAEPFFCWFINFISKSFLKLCRIYLIGIVCLMLIGTFTFFISRLNALVFCGGWGRDPARAEPFFCWFINFISKSFLKLCRIYLIGIVCLMLIGTFTFFISRLNALVFCGGWGRDPARAEPFFCWFINFISKSFLKLCRIYLIGIVCLMLIGTFTFFISRLNALVFCGGWGRDPARAEPFFCWFINFISKSFLKLCRIYLIGIVCLMLIGTFTFFISRLNALVFCGGWGRDPARAEPFFCWFINFISKSFLKLCRIYLIGIVCLMLIGTFTFFISRLNALVFCGGWGRDPARAEPFFCWFINFISKSFLKLCRIYLIGIVCLMLIGTFTFFISRLNALVFCGGWGRDPARAEPFFCWFINFISKSFLKLCRIYLIGIVCLMLIGTFTFFISRLNALVFCGGWGRDPARAEPFFCWFINFISKSFLKLCRIYLIGIVCLMLIGTFTFFISRLNALVFCGGWGRDPARAEPFFCWFINFISKSFLKLCRIYLIGIVCLMLIGTFTFFISRLNALVFCGGWGRDPARAEPFFCWFINFISKSFLKLCRIYLIGIVCLMLIGTFTFFISRLNALVFCGGWGRDPARAEPFFCWFINFISKSFLKLCRIYLIGIVCLMLIGTFTFFISRLNALVFCGGWGRDPARAEPFFCWFINFISKSFLKLCRIYLIGIVCLMLIGTFTFFISRLNALVFCGGWGRDPARAEPFFCWFINFISKSFLKLCRIYLIGIVCLMLIGTFTFFISRLNALVFCGGWGRDPARAEPFFCWFINFISKSFLKLCRIYLIGIVCLMLIGTFTFFISRLNALVFCGGWGRDPARAEPFFCWFINFISKSFLKLCRIYLIGIVCLMLIGTFTFFISRLNALVFCGGWGRDPARAEPFFCWFINFISKSFLKLCRIYLIGIVCLMLIGTFTFFISRLNALVFCGGWGRDPARAEPFFCWFINFISKSFLKLCRIYLIGIVCLMLIGTFTFFISRLNALVFCGGWGRDPARAEPFFCWFINFISKSFLKLCRIYLIGIVCLMLIGTFTFFISRLNALVFCGGWGRDPARAEPFFCWFINFISKSFLKLCRIYLIGIVCLMLIGTFTFFISRLNALVFCGGWGRDPARAEPFFCWFINFISKSFLKLCRIYLIGIVCLMLIKSYLLFLSSYIISPFSTTLINNLFLNFHYLNLQHMFYLKII